MSDVIAVKEEFRMRRLLNAAKQDIVFYFKTIRLQFTRRLPLLARRLQTANSTGNDIVLFQERFNHFAERYGIIVPVTGVYDECTRSSVAEFQGRAMYILDGDGFVGPETARILHIKLLGV